MTAARTVTLRFDAYSVVTTQNSFNLSNVRGVGEVGKRVGVANFTNFSCILFSLLFNLLNFARGFFFVESSLPYPQPRSLDFGTIIREKLGSGLHQINYSHVLVSFPQFPQDS